MTTSKTVTPSEVFSVRAPLLALERVHRRTGMIRKTCTFHNPSDQTLELQVRHGFREHSWIQLVPEHEERDVGEKLLLEPGETRVHLLINTDSSNFPYDRFRGRIYFQDTEAATVHWIEISFEEIEELQDFDGYAAIDLGTSNSIIALYHLQEDAMAGEPWNPALQGDQAEVPSAVFLRDLSQFRKLAEGSCSVGQTALRDYRENATNDPRSLQLGVKRLIGAERVLGVDSNRAGGYVDPLAILQMLARTVRERSQSHDRVRARLRKLLVTFPPTWDYHQISRWKEVFKRLGFSDEDLDLSLDEASAAGLFHVFRWMRNPDERNRLLQDLMSAEEKSGAEEDRYTLRLLSFDFGGGTMDLALIAVALTVRDDVIRMRVTLEGSDSLAFGGDQVTLALFRILKRRLALALSDPRRAAGHVPSTEQDREDVQAGDAIGDSGLFLLPSTSLTLGLRHIGSSEESKQEIRNRWQELEEHITDELLPTGLDDAVDAVFSTRFWSCEEEPIRPAAKQNFSWLWDRAESLKREMFRAANRRAKGLSLTDIQDRGISGGIPVRDIPEEVAERRFQGPDFETARIQVTVGEIYRCIAKPLDNALLSARRLAGDVKVDRIVLTGQSSWIPQVRRLFMRPRSEGGFGLAPNRIEFDEENAKAAVSKGACLLRVLREALVGIDVDVSTFRANLLSDIFYRSTVEGVQPLFAAGPIDDLQYAEQSPDPASFARHLSVFQGSPPSLMGRFDFDAAEQLPSFEEFARKSAATPGGDDRMPTHAEFQRIQEPERKADIRNALAEWPEKALIAWVEASATPGSIEKPIYRYYLTRNRNLFAVRDRGADKQLFSLRIIGSRSPVSARDNPFSGTH